MDFDHQCHRLKSLFGGYSGVSWIPFKNEIKKLPSYMKHKWFGLYLADQNPLCIPYLPDEMLSIDALRMYKPKKYDLIPVISYKYLKVLLYLECKKLCILSNMKLELFYECIFDLYCDGIIMFTEIPRSNLCICGNYNAAKCWINRCVKLHNDRWNYIELPKYHYVKSAVSLKINYKKIMYYKQNYDCLICFNF
jgi:hypothetical protein